MSPTLLVTDAQRGSESALDDLLAKYEPLVRRVVRHYFLPGHEHEDILQEGFIGLLHGIRTYDSKLDPSLENHLMRCVRNQMMGALRKANRKRHRVLTDARSFEDSEGDSYLISRLSGRGGDPEEVVINRLSLMGVLRSLDKLSSHERSVLWATLQGFSHREIVDATGLSPKQIENSLYRARTKIRRLHDAYMPDTLCG